MSWEMLQMCQFKHYLYMLDFKHYSTTVFNMPLPMHFSI
jgi:hypothetical protein